MTDGDQRSGAEAAAVVVIVVEDVARAQGGVAGGAKREAGGGGAAPEMAIHGAIVDVVGPGELGASDDGRDQKAEEACRICHLSVDPGKDCSELFRLGCGCKGELGVAHRHCAEAWFRIKGNRFCEICGANAKNITGDDDGKFMDEWYERGEFSNRSSTGRCACWRQQPFCNFLMACLVIAFILPWFLRVNMF